MPARRPSEFQRTGVFTLRGPFFEKRITKVVQRQIMEQAMPKFEKRLRRKGRKIGRKRNPIPPGTLELGGGVALVMTSPKNYPRTTGRKWQAHNVAAIKAMAPRVLRKLARQIVGELN